MSAHDKQMVLHQTLQQLQQLGGSADPDNMLAVSDQELVDHTNVVTDQDLFIVVENDEQSAEVIVNPNGNIGMIRMVSLSSFWSGSGSYFYSYSQRQYSCPAPYSVFRSLFPSLISRSLGLWWSDFRNSKVCIIPFSWSF